MIGRMETPPPAERRDIAWRAALLRDAGLDQVEAHAVARQRTLDVHQLASLLERGCPLHLGLRIVDERVPA